MSGSSVSDCYLCGARNDAEADYCVRCNGQLLKLPGMSEDPEEFLGDDLRDDLRDDFRDDLGADDSDEIVERIDEPRAPVAKKGSLEDQRLSAALGLADDVVDPGFVETMVTSIPRATPAADIPHLGTRAGVVPQAAMAPKEFGRRTYVLLGLLLLATAWLGYTTLSERNRPAPDNLAFNDLGSRVPEVTSTTTTEKPRREWTQSEVDGRFGPTFVRITMFVCSAEGQVAVDESVGVAVDTHNVLFDPAPLPTANAIAIRSRTGRLRGAIITDRVDGLAVATSLVATSRNLALDVIEGPPAYNVGYNPETNVVTTTEEPQDLPAQIWVTATGDAHDVTLNGTTVSGEELMDIDHRIEVNPESVLPKDPTFCDQIGTLRPVGGEDAVDDLAEAETETDVPQPEAE